MAHPKIGYTRSHRHENLKYSKRQYTEIYISYIYITALRTGRLYPPGNTPGTHFCYRLSDARAMVRSEGFYINEKFQ